MILKMIDGGILNISEDRNYNSGCPTCDYGASYVSNVDISMTKIDVYITANGSYDYPLAIGDFMEIMFPCIEEIQQMKEMEFAKWLEEKLRERVKKLGFTYRNK